MSRIAFKHISILSFLLLSISCISLPYPDKVRIPNIDLKSCTEKYDSKNKEKFKLDITLDEEKKEKSKLEYYVDYVEFFTFSINSSIEIPRNTLFYHIYIQEKGQGLSYIQASGDLTNVLNADRKTGKKEEIRVFFGEVDSFKKKYKLFISVNCEHSQKIDKISEVRGEYLDSDIGYRKIAKFDFIRHSFSKRNYCPTSDDLESCNVERKVIVTVKDKVKDKCLHINNSVRNDLKVNNSTSIEIPMSEYEPIESITLGNCSTN